MSTSTTRRGILELVGPVEGDRGNEWWRLQAEGYFVSMDNEVITVHIAKGRLSERTETSGQVCSAYRAAVRETLYL